MKDEYYDAGNDDACIDMGLEKEAFVGALRSIGSKALASKPAQTAIGGLTSAKAAPKAIGNKLGPHADKFDQGVAKGVGKAFGPTAEKATSGLMKGTGREVARQGAWGAGLVGGLQGGIGALTAPEGQGTEQFFKGLGQGALMGAGFGVGSGMATAPMRNLRSKSLQQMAKRQSPGIGANASKEMADQQLQRGWFKSVGDLVRPGGGKSPLGRSGAAANVLGGPTQLGGEFMGGEMVMMPFGMSMLNDHSDGTGATPSPYQGTPARQIPYQQLKTSSEITQQQESPIPAPLVGSVTGGGLGGLSTKLLVNAAKTKGKIPGGAIGTATEHVAPFAGSATGALSGYYAGTQMEPEPETNWEEKLNKIDFDKLMRYYRKREADQG